MGKTKYLSAFEQGMVVGARRTGLGQELQILQVFHQTVPCLYQEWSTTQRTSSQFETTVGSIGVNMRQHPCGTLSTPCREHARRIGVQLNIRKVFLMFGILSV